MKNYFGSLVLGSIIFWGSSVAEIQAQQSLFLAYPPQDHQTTASQIFLIGTVDPQQEVEVNGTVIPRSPAGNFAPSFPLQMGENVFTIRSGNQEIQVKVTRISATPEPPQGVAFSPNSLTPSRDIARLPGELVCFGAIAPNNANVTVSLGGVNLNLSPQPPAVQLPPNNAVLTAQNQPTSLSNIGKYQGCTTFSTSRNFGTPRFQLSLNGETVTQEGTGKVEILTPDSLEIIEVTANSGAARTGASTNHSRLTPLPKGTRAAVTGREGEWLRLDYGAWIKEAETQIVPDAVPPQAIIRSVTSRQVSGATEIVFPLTTPIPISFQQTDQVFTLNLHNTIAQTDTIRLDDNPLIKRLDWQVVAPTQVQYSLVMKTDQQWGYELRYEGTSLILSLRHPPSLSSQVSQPLDGISILLDPGHGGNELGARGPNGYPEKDVNLVVSKLLQQELLNRGATVYMTRETDVDVSLRERMDMIAEVKPTLALSIHYNALPDSGDAINTAGVGMFWYHAQAHDLAIFMQEYLVERLNRPDYGVFWNNLALTRPHAAPTILLELGFMINPVEFEWITNPAEQQKLASALADGIVAWLRSKE